MSKQQPALSYLWEATRKNRLVMVLLIATEVVLSLLNIDFVLSMRSALDGAAKQDETAFRHGLVCMLVIVVLRIVLRVVRRELDERVRSSVENNLRGRLLHHLLHGSYAQTESVHTGEWMNRMTSDTTVVAGGLTELLPSFLGMAVKLIGAAVMILTMLPNVSYLLLPAGAAAIGVTWLLRRAMKQQHKAVQERDGLVRMFLQERLGNMMIVRAFRAEPLVEAEAEHRMARHKQARMQRARISNLCNAGFAALMNGLYVVSFVYCGYGILAGTVTYGTLLAVIQLLGQIQAPFAGLSGIIPRFYSMTASAERLLEAEQFEQEPVDVPPVEQDFSALCLDHVSFSYPGDPDRAIFSDVSVCIRKGDYVALTGHSGCGKSTLFKLLLCLYPPAEGALLVHTADGAAPLGVCHRSLFAYVPQGNQLMSGTIREVVTFAAGAQTDLPKLRNALRIACADDFVSALEHGLDTVLGEHGAGLSEGQLQRLAIARAIYADAPILLFDESTSALDAQTEQQVLANLRAMTDKTVLIVTHRPAALEVCSRIIEVSEGRLLEQNGIAAV